MEAVIVYSKKNCMHCQFTKKFLTEKQIEFQEKDVEQDEQALNEVKALGFTSLPIIVGPGIAPFQGFRPDKLEQLRSK